jgi:hypothetical protein
MQLLFSPYRQPLSACLQIPASVLCFHLFGLPSSLSGCDRLGCNSTPRFILNLGFALPEVWVKFESDNEVRVPVSCNPLDLELVPKNYLEAQTPTEPAIQGSYIVQIELDEPNKDEIPLQVPIGTCENLLFVENELR